MVAFWFRAAATRAALAIAEDSAGANGQAGAKPKLCARKIARGLPGAGCRWTKILWKQKVNGPSRGRVMVIIHHIF
jgi:hypothetical protein